MELYQLKGAYDLAQIRHDAAQTEESEKALNAAKKAYEAALPGNTDTAGDGAGGGTSVTTKPATAKPADSKPAKTSKPAADTAKAGGVVDNATPEATSQTGGDGSEPSEEKKSE